MRTEGIYFAKRKRVLDIGRQHEEAIVDKDSNCRLHLWIVSSAVNVFLIRHGLRRE